ncbi:RNA methyltransferase [Actinokineospora auranticolor]|uniref:tRNA G18 (Ribose-2'-O)-methylase SpoU n=1 Tax=Actinokineospora auranticolor TaxID=155976 RepID=A0A2S6GZC3_9PSEU|nr:RNA methyltransferase [Actinokineospora auranticolor]PPK70507.1 tRNA G18 (ribose-2'-O)-methylase SpoU [Actinokineospora auranticolor]
MAQVIEVTDPADPRLDDFRDLSTADRRPDRPGGRGLVIAEGVVVVQRLLASPYPVRALLGVRRRIDALAPELAALDVPAYVASADVMAETVGFHLNRGVLAAADRAPAPDPVHLIERVRTVAVLEGVGDHENLGALFRNAAALGVDAVLLGPGCSDPLYRRSVRVSMGHVLAVPFAPLEPWPDGLKWLRDSGFRVLALTPAADSVALADAVDAHERVAVLLGSEGPGLTPEAIAAADTAVRIPMARGVDSLNVATAAAVTFYALGERGSGGTARQG